MGASAGAIRAGKAYVEIYGDDSPLQKKLNGVSSTLKSWGGSITSLGAKVFAAGAVVKGALGGAIALFEEAGTQLRGMSLRTGASVEALSTLGFVAEQSGVDMEGLEMGLRKMQKMLGGVEEGSSEAAETLARLGLSIDELKGLTPDEQFRRIGARLAAIPDPTLRAADAMKIFGKSGTSLLPMLAHGAEGMAELEEQARQLGLEWSGPEAESAAKLHHALGALWAVIKKGTANIGAALADDLTGLVVSATQIVAATGKWIKENKGLVVGLNLVAGLVLGLGAALIVLGTTLSAAGTVIGVIGTVITALLSPTALVIAAVVGLGGAILYYSGAGKAALSWLTDAFGQLKADAEKTFQGISDALSTGNIQLAMKILWLSLQVEWTKGINFLSEKWDAFNGWVAKRIIDASFGIRETWLNLTFFMEDAWNGFIDAFKNGWNDAQAWLSKRMIDVLEIVGSLSESEARAARRELGKKSDDRQLLENLPNPKGPGAGPVGAQRVDPRQDAIDALHADRDALKGAVDAVNGAAAAADAGKVAALERDRDAAIALAAANKKKGDGGHIGADAHGFEPDVATASKHGPIAGVDVKSTEGFKSVLTAVNEGRDNPQTALVTTQREALGIQKKQRKLQQDTLDHMKKIGIVGL